MENTTLEKLERNFKPQCKNTLQFSELSLSLMKVLKKSRKFLRCSQMLSSDRGNVWNTDLIETMELENLLVQAKMIVNSA